MNNITYRLFGDIKTYTLDRHFTEIICLLLLMHISTIMDAERKPGCNEHTLRKCNNAFFVRNIYEFFVGNLKKPHAL